MRANGFSLVELTVATAIVGILAVFTAGAGWKVYESSSLAVSAENIRQLSAGAANYLAENNHRYWKFRIDEKAGTTFWFGFESSKSMRRPEGERVFDPSLGPLGGYVPAALKPDPSFQLGARAFKPKYAWGYIGVGYNSLLGGGMSAKAAPVNYFSLKKPSGVVVFATSAQVNTFQPPASAKKPMLEDFYLLDERETTVHFRHHGNAMVAYADGSAGFLPMDESTRDNRMPNANVGRFAPIGSKDHLQ
jgi:prepilin-type N-terminal cleavage/methylation domain-containing protein